MSSQPAAHPAPPDARNLTEPLAYAREVLLAEAGALAALASQLDASFARAVDLLFACQGSVLVTGIGKAGWIGQKISATLASTGTRSHFLHPSEAIHGDLGRVHPSDVVLVLSQSGETEEVVRLLPALARFGVPVIALTAQPGSTLGRAADVVLHLGQQPEACSLGLAPSTSTTAMLGLGDALALVTSRRRGFAAEDFARFHPGGSLGRKLSKVHDHMRPLAECRLAREGMPVREMLAACTRPGRRTGAVMLTDEQGKLTGIFTDSDLVKLLEHRREAALDGAVSEVMTRGPSTIAATAPMSDAVALLARRKISELPVIDDEGRPIGLVDITDLAGIWPEMEGSLAEEDDVETPRTLPFYPRVAGPGA